MTSYHLWLMPSGRLYDLLAETITSLSTIHRAPRFEPHVTLVGHLHGSEPEIILTTSQLAEQLEPFEVRLTTPAYTAEYFRCLFLKAERSSSLLDAHSTARALFHLESGPPYEPHLSLLYGRYPETLKDQIVRDLPVELSGRFRADRLELIRAESDEPKDWIRIRTISFGPSP